MLFNGFLWCRILIWWTVHCSHCLVFSMIWCWNWYDQTMISHLQNGLFLDKILKLKHQYQYILEISKLNSVCDTFSNEVKSYTMLLKKKSTNFKSNCAWQALRLMWDEFAIVCGVESLLSVIYCIFCRNTLPS